MNKIVLKRLAAYLIDIVIIYSLVSLIASIPVFNKNEDEYTEEMSNYTELYTEYLTAVSNEDITEDETNEILEKLTISNYKLSKLGINSTIINYSMYIIYFVIILYLTEGQTIGKKLLKLKIVSDNNKKVSIIQLLLRGIVLYGFATSLASILLLMFASQNTYIEYSTVITTIESMLCITSVGFLLFTKDSRALHDIISKTHVIETKEEI